MDYRDERDALRGRVDNLEQELGAAKRELEGQRGDDRKARIAELEAQMKQARRVLEGMEGELAALKGAPAKKAPNVPMLLAGGATALLAGGAVAAMVLVRASPPPTPVYAPPLGTVAALPSVEPQKPAEPPAKPTKPVRTAQATWSAKVTRGTGAAPAPGTACTVEAKLTSRDAGVHADELVVTCAGKVLYRSTDKLEGMSMFGSGAEEHAGPKAGSYVYSVAWDDKGTRNGARNEISLDTKAGVAAVWRTSVSAFHVELSVSKESAPVSGPALAE